MRPVIVRLRFLLAAATAAVLILPMSAASLPRGTYLVACSEINGPPRPGIRGNEASIGGVFGDALLVERLWNAHAAAFDLKDWDNFKPDSNYEKVVLESAGKKLVLKSWHRTVERDERNIVTSRGVESAMGKSRAEILKADDPSYMRRREAFDSIIDACITEGAKYQAKFREEWPKQQAEREASRRNQESKETTRKFTGAIFFGGMLLAFSLLWYGPLAMCLSIAEEKGRSRLGWLTTTLALSPLGWASIDPRNIRMWMIPLSIVTPFLCAVLLKALPTGSDNAPRTKAWHWGLRVLILAYAFNSASGAFQYVACSMTANSSDKASLGSLGAVRSSMSIYYGDTEGAYPRDLSALMPKYISVMPEVKTLSRGNIIHLASNKVTNFPTYQSNDGGGWGYVNQRLLPDGSPNPQYGNIFINCTHTDLSHGKSMADY